MCGVVGIFGHPEASTLAYLSLYALQHRGQESAGIVTSDGDALTRRAGMGLVADVFSRDVLASLPGRAAIGHVRYSTAGDSHSSNAQPFLLRDHRGPIAIAQMAGETARAGMLSFLFLVAVLSVNLGVLNLLPIPILDGGQIVFALAEGVKGEPLSMRVREIAAQIGVSLLVLLMGFAFWNDLSRYWSRIINFFEGLV